MSYPLRFVFYTSEAHLPQSLLPRDDVDAVDFTLDVAEIEGARGVALRVIVGERMQPA